MALDWVHTQYMGVSINQREQQLMSRYVPSHRHEQTDINVTIGVNKVMEMNRQIYGYRYKQTNVNMAKAVNRLI